MDHDTIIAISTPLGYGGLGVVRLSGKSSRKIAARIFRKKTGAGRTLPPRTSVLGHLINPETGEALDEALLIYFPAPRSYTREDMVEISCHGSPAVLEEAVRLGLREGARHARPGEFTLRAFLNGRLDILQAQAVNDLIMAQSLEQARISFRQLDGSLSRKIKALRSRIIDVLSMIETSIEFPEDGPAIPSGRIEKALNETIGGLDRMIESYDAGKALLEGLTLVITGKPNVGKSTLFNALLEKDRAIVTPYPGTTRDYLRETLKVKDSLFTLIDTAGMSRSSHPVEKEGRERGRKLAAEADSVLFVLDASRKESAEDRRILEKLKGKKVILVLNKTDLPVRLDKKRFQKSSERWPCVGISARNGTNISRLKDLIRERFVPVPVKGDETILHLRQKLLLEDVRTSITAGLMRMREGHSEEVVVEEIRKALPPLGELTGEIKHREIIDNIFSRFCIGK